MKPYGLPRIPAAEFPEKSCCQEFGRASHIANISGKSGDFHPASRTNNKRRTRKIWKGKERAKSRRELRRELEKWYFYFVEDWNESELYYGSELTDSEIRTMMEKQQNDFILKEIEWEDLTVDDGPYLEHFDEDNDLDYYYEEELMLKSFRLALK